MDISAIGSAPPIETKTKGKKNEPVSTPLKDSVDISSSKGDELMSKMAKLREKAVLLHREDPTHSTDRLSSTKESSTVEGFKSGFVKNFMDARAVDNKIMELAKAYPHLMSVETRDFKTSGYDGKMEHLRGPAPLRYIRIGNKNSGEDPSQKTGVLLLAAPHAREVMQPMIMLETAQQLLANYNPHSQDPTVKEISDLINNLDIYIVPVSNPDGLNYAIHDDPNWRKTRSPIPGSTEKGVDTNRNYDYKWKESNPSENTYSGPYPFSEPETRHVAEIVEQHPNIKFIADFHSQGEEIRMPIGVKDQKDIKYFREIQDRLASSIAKVRGTKYRQIESRVVNGASDDYFYFKKGAYSFVIEDGKEYKPPLGEALSVVAEGTECAKELLRVAKEYKA